MLNTGHALLAARLFQDKEAWKRCLFIHDLEEVVTPEEFAKAWKEDFEFFENEWSWGRVTKLLASNDIPITEWHFQYHADEDEESFMIEGGDVRDLPLINPFFEALQKFMISPPTLTKLKDWE